MEMPIRANHGSSVFGNPGDFHITKIRTICRCPFTEGFARMIPKLNPIAFIVVLVQTCNRINVRNAGEIAGMRILSEGAATAQSSAQAPSADAGSLGGTGPWE